MQVRKIFGMGLLSTLAATTVFADPELTRWEDDVPSEVSEANALADELIQQIKNDYVRGGKRAFRDAHPRGIGCVAAKFTVNESVPDEYKKYLTGIFSEPGKSYDALVRYSSALNPVGDNVNDARGMAVKVFGVPGRKLLNDQPNATTQDFLHINGPFFPARNAREFAGIVHAKTNPFSIVSFLAGAPILRAYELKALMDLSSKNEFNGKTLLASRFQSMTPYGIQAVGSTGVDIPVKFASLPCETVTLKPLNGTSTELRDDLQERLEANEACFDFVLQFYNPNAASKQDIEDGMSHWKEADSPFIKFAKITIPSQSFKTDEKLRYCDNLSFQPWHTTESFQPLGSINRARKIVYERISKFRHDNNMENNFYPEPTDISAWQALQSTTYDVWKGEKIPASR